jgi:hypothetical protein
MQEYWIRTSGNEVPEICTLSRPLGDFYIAHSILRKLPDSHEAVQALTQEV